MAEIHIRAAPRWQRTNDRVLHYWRDLCGDRAFPTPADVVDAAEAHGEEAEGLKPNVFVLYFNGYPLESVFTMGSEVLESACGVETSGHRVADCLPDALRDSMLSFVRTLARTRKPIAVSSSFANQSGDEVLYRSIYLPLSADQNSVGYLLGAFSFKKRPAA